MSINMRNWKLAVVGLALVFTAKALTAQEPETPAEPKPAGRGIPGIDEGTPQDQNAAQDALDRWNPDTMPVTGLQSPTVGNPEFRHSYWVPGFQFSSSIQDQPSGTANSGNWYSYNFFGANLSLSQQWNNSSLMLNYSGGGFVTNQPGQSNGWYQQLALAQTFTWRRWQMQILDQFGYLPQSQFGFGGGTGLGVPGIGGPLGPPVPGIGGSVSPNQSIYAAVGPQYNNSFVTQLTYQTSRRGSITVGGSYGLLRFTEAGNVDSDSYMGSIGYNYQLTKEDSIGLYYRFIAFHYQSEPQAIGDQLVNVTYSRKVAKRLALQIFGGPEITNYRVPVGNESQTVAGNGGINLTSMFHNGNASIGYFHALSGGSGVLIGSSTDQITAGAGRRLTRLWSVHGNFGFAKNRPLASQTGTQGSNYNSFYIGGGLDRPIGKNINFSVAYNAQIQQVNPTVCAGPGCDTSYTQNVVTLNFQWHTRPFVLR
jgi:hypothetical protein